VPSPRKRDRAAYFQRYNARKGRRASAGEKAGERVVLGIDGEGYTLPDGSHRYVYLAAASREGFHSDVRNPKGLTADEVFGWLMTLPKQALLVGFALGYDRTKWVESWPDERVWRLMHPDHRQGEHGPLPVDCGAWRVNLVATRMTVKRKADSENRTVWDVWKFFQSSFVKAIGRWGVGTRKEQAFIAKQKERRGNFRAISRKEELYCQTECRLLAELVSQLLGAHDDAGLKLRSYFGPGSTAAGVLAEMGADVQKARVPDAMAVAVACAYFGGRFELSRMGPLPAKELYSWDIVSAYPWAFTRLPCMCSGRWVHKKGLPRRHHPIATCVRFEVRPHKRAHPAWGPLPHRLPDGNILFPLESAGGWAWVEEFKAGKKLHPGVRALSSWTWVPRCKHPPPFAEKVQWLFDKRAEWGKGAKGLVLKLALNSLYGKSAQRVGSGRFRCMVRAGLVTSMARSRLLELVALAHDPWDVLELATDSVLSRAPIAIPPQWLGKGLGQWEDKSVDTKGRNVWRGGIFLMRPGLRFPLRRVTAKTPKAKREALFELVAARGVGGKTLFANSVRIAAAWQKEPMAPVTVQTPSFFHGAKLAVRVGLGPPTEDGRDPVYTRDALYGRWTTEHRTLTYAPKPKRESVLPDMRLEPWRLPRGKGCESVPYGVAGQSTAGDELDRMRELEEDQPDKQAVALV
jgi:hypothetical protein